MQALWVDVGHLHDMLHMLPPMCPLDSQSLASHHPLIPVLISAPRTPGTIVYNIKDNRWCARISGPHKSNGIYLVVDVRGGTWCQKCYDPDCRWGPEHEGLHRHCAHLHARCCMLGHHAGMDQCTPKPGAPWLVAHHSSAAIELVHCNLRHCACVCSHCPHASCC